MDTRLLRHYEGELAYLRGMGAEFAASYPKIAARLGMEGTEVADPYVERLLEGVAFLSARVQLELDLQYPALTAHLLEIVYPHYLAPVPSMMIATLQPDPSVADLTGGYLVARGTTLRSRIDEGAQTACLFRTAHDVTLWPLEISQADYIDGRGALVAAGVGADVPQARAAVRLRLSALGGARMADLALDRLTLFLGDAGAGRAWDLHALLATRTCGLAGRSTDRRDDWVQPLTGGNSASISARGYGPEEALLPTPAQSFDGYRLLQEYFAMPERFRFLDLAGLGPAVRRASGTDLDIYILLSENQPDLAASVVPAAFGLHATPAVNLFERRCDRVQISPRTVEHQVIPDRTAPLDFEVHSLRSVTGISEEGSDDVIFHPFYSADDFTAAGDTHPAYYTLVRRMRARTERERLRGARTSYLGTDVYLSLVDPQEAPYRAGIGQLAVTAICSNRDLPLLLSTGGADLFHLPDGGPVRRIDTPVAPTRPRPMLGQGNTAWRLISHLSLNYLSIADTDQGGGIEALRELVGIYAPAGDRTIAKQIEGLTSVSSRPVVRRISDGVLSTAVRGLQIRIGVDESFFEGTSPYVLGSVLERFFRRHVTVNSFTETLLESQQRGEIARWKPDQGLGRII
jgi:type VI secretion system protein ImpG